MLVIVVLPNPGPQPVFDEMRLFGASRDGRAVAHRAIAPLNQLNSRAEEAQSQNKKESSRSPNRSPCPCVFRWLENSHGAPRPLFGVAHSRKTASSEGVELTAFGREYRAVNVSNADSPKAIIEISS